MKKSLIALAALATVATAAQAQSSVTVYGVMDMGYATVDGVGSGNKRVSGLQNGGLATSRLGFRGTEDLGGGLAANFNLEAEILADTGSQASTQEALFARASWVGLSQNGVGSVQLGRLNTFSYEQAIAGDAFGANNLGGFVAASNGFYVRMENAVSLRTANLNGFQAGVQSGTRTSFQSFSSGDSVIVNYGEVAGKTSGNRLTNYFASYANGPVELGASWGEQKNAAGEKMNQITNAFARYNFGTIKLFSGWAQQKNSATVYAASATNGTETAASTTAKVTTYFVGVTAAVTPKTTLMANAIQVKNDFRAAATQDTEPRVYALGAKYDLSKRTALYAIAAKSDQDGTSTQRIANAGKFNYSNAGDYTNGVAPGSGLNQTGYMVGIRHSF